MQKPSSLISLKRWKVILRYLRIQLFSLSGFLSHFPIQLSVILKATISNHFPAFFISKADSSMTYFLSQTLLKKVNFLQNGGMPKKNFFINSKLLLFHFRACSDSFHLHFLVLNWVTQMKRRKLNRETTKLINANMRV